MAIVSIAHVLEALDLSGYEHHRLELKGHGVHQCYRKGDVRRQEMTLCVSLRNHKCHIYCGVIDGGMVVTGSRWIEAVESYLPQEVLVDRAKHALGKLVIQHQKMMNRVEFLKGRRASRDDFRCVVMLALENGIIDANVIPGIMDRLYGIEPLTPIRGDKLRNRDFSVWDLLKAFWGVKFKLGAELDAQGKLMVLMIREFGGKKEREYV